MTVDPIIMKTAENRERTAAFATQVQNLTAVHATDKASQDAAIAGAVAYIEKLDGMHTGAIIKREKTGLSATIPASGVVQLVPHIAAGSVLFSGNTTPDVFTFNGDVMKFPVNGTGFPDRQVDYTITLRINGDISTLTGDKALVAELVRVSDGQTLIKDELVKVDNSNLESAQVIFETYTAGADDPFVTDGIKLQLRNKALSNGTLKGITAIIKAKLRPWAYPE